jgi:hypothetical protein
LPKRAKFLLTPFRLIRIIQPIHIHAAASPRPTG